MSRFNIKTQETWGLKVFFFVGFFHDILLCRDAYFVLDRVRMKSLFIIIVFCPKQTKFKLDSPMHVVAKHR